MLEIFGDLWEVEADLRVVTTNPVVNGAGAAVMGRGCAREAKGKVPGIEYHFARRLQEHGNRVMLLATLPDGSRLASFPVKHHWRRPAVPELIRRSADQHVGLVDKFRESHGIESVVLPRPGCGNGSLLWEDVRPLLAGVLDDRFSVVTFPVGDHPPRR